MELIHPTMTAEQQLRDFQIELQYRIKKYLNNNGTYLNELARKAEVSLRTVTQMHNATFKGNFSHVISVSLAMGLAPIVQLIDKVEDKGESPMIGKLESFRRDAQERRLMDFYADSMSDQLYDFLFAKLKVKSKTTVLQFITKYSREELYKIEPLTVSRNVDELVGLFAAFGSLWDYLHSKEHE